MSSQEHLRALIEENIEAYHKARSQNQSDAEFDFLRNLVNADKFFNQADKKKKDKK